MKNSIKAIAVTGGIGSGKSLALSVLKNNGYKVLSSDEIVVKLYKKKSVLKKVKALFPSVVKGKLFLSLDKVALSNEVFFDCAKHKALTDLITPLVFEHIKRRIKRAKQNLFIEIPLLFECGCQKDFDNVIVITRPLKDRIESVKKRSNLTEEQILARIKKQVNYDELDLTSYIVIENVGAVDTFRDRVLSVAKSI